MENKTELINQFLGNVPGVKITTVFTVGELDIAGSITIDFDGGELPFDIKINFQYPFRCRETETIRFFNKNLIEYDHVMKDGHVCIHTLHSPDLKTKLSYDINSLKEWIDRYYLKKKGDLHYEHIIVPICKYKNYLYTFLFTETVESFKKGDFGLCKYTQLPFEGIHHEDKTCTYIIKRFEDGQKNRYCAWSPEYANFNNNGKDGDGVFVFIENAPTVNKRFVIDTWDQLEPHVDVTFKNYVFNLRALLGGDTVDAPFPVFIGYKIPTGEVHWQCALIDLRKFPIEPQKFNGKWYPGYFRKEEITWAQTRNISYKYFFGRGKLCEVLTESKILIVGIGAIGSNLAVTLARGGCKSIGIVDYDLKEPENVCRAEYPFITGITAKVMDLTKSLLGISPFLEIRPSEWFTDMMKYAEGHQAPERERVLKELSEYDIIFDCSTDDDMAYILDAFELKAKIINLSITNHARELVCVSSPKIYENMNAIYSIIKQDTTDLYNPTGCWSPTFKASYNDIVSLVQYSIMQINHKLKEGRELRNFIISKEDKNSLDLKMKEF